MGSEACTARLICSLVYAPLTFVMVELAPLLLPWPAQFAVSQAVCHCTPAHGTLDSLEL